MLSRSLIRRKEARSVKPDYHPQWKLMRVISGHLGWVRSVAVEPGNQWFATGAGDRVIKVSCTALSALALADGRRPVPDLGFSVRRAQAVPDRSHLDCAWTCRQSAASVSVQLW